MAHVEDVLLEALAQEGDRYIFGAEALPSDPDPGAFDCSELVEWACARAGVSPKMPDGAYYQWVHATKNHDLALPVAKAVHTRGALLFVGDGTGVGRDAITHVAWSLGDGRTIEARGSRWGVGIFPAEGRFDFAAYMPGVDYSAGRVQVPPVEDNGLPVYPGGVWKKGARGGFVVTIQTLAERAGCANGRWAIDGIFGKLTENAVRCFQRKIGVNDDGAWGPVTQARAEKVLAYIAATAK